MANRFDDEGFGPLSFAVGQVSQLPLNLIERIHEELLNPRLADPEREELHGEPGHTVAAHEGRVLRNAITRSESSSSSPKKA